MIDSSELAAGVEIERLMSELVDRLAACPCAVIDPRAWDQLRIYAPYGLRKRPVAFRYKDSVDGWVYTENESEAQQAFHNGHDTQGLYVRDGT
jgi:hypothetical protein